MWRPGVFFSFLRALFPSFTLLFPFHSPILFILWSEDPVRRSLASDLFFSVYSLLQFRFPGLFVYLLYFGS